PPMLPAAGQVTARAKAVATAASTALPPRCRTARPASAAAGDTHTTRPLRASTAGVPAAACAGGLPVGAESSGRASASAAANATKVRRVVRRAAIIIKAPRSQDRLWTLGAAGGGPAMISSVDTFPSLECTNILGREREPLSFFALARKAGVPIVLYADRIICLDVMHRLQLLGQLDPD